MYPNAQDVFPLPPNADVGLMQARAQELVRACEAGPESIIGVIAGWFVPSRHAYQFAQYAATQLAEFGCSLDTAQRILAHGWGFEGWPAFEHHLRALADPNEPIAKFEAAADAIVAGDAESLRRMLKETPALVHACSTRTHRATLLHYVSANGVENYRQITPPNIIEITRDLLAAGAEVDAEAEMYGGGSRTLGLVVTSAHPRQAGVQIELADLLIEHGARVEPSVVRDCLANGCPEAAAHMAGYGVTLTLDDAAGIGDINRVRKLLADAPHANLMIRAMMTACWYNRVDVVTLLLDSGVSPAALSDDGSTALHIAAYNGHTELVDLLLRRGAPIDVRDAQYGTTPVRWAMHAWRAERRPDEARYRSVVQMLLDAGKFDIDALTIREASAADLPALAQLHVVTWNATYAPFGMTGPSVAVRDAQWREKFEGADPDWFCFVVERSDGELVGFAQGNRSDNPDYEGELGKIYLLPEYQSRGLGRRLLHYVARRFLDRGIHSMWLYGDARNPSRFAWLALGAEKTDNDPGNGNYGWRDLRQLLLGAT